MKELGLTGIVAVIPTKVGRKHTVAGEDYPCMTVKDLKQLIAEGWEMASHSLTHPQPSSDGKEFCELTNMETQMELRESKEWIRRNLGVNPTKFVVPRHFLRREQMEFARRHYVFVRSFPLGFPEGHIVFHHIKSKFWFTRRLKRFGVIPKTKSDKILDAISKCLL